MKSVTSAEAIRNFGDLISEVRHGPREIVITPAGAPVARLVPPALETMNLREFLETLDGR
jgi:prevent-host-death family protein